MEQKHRVGETGMVYQFRVVETGVCKMGMDEMRVGKMGVGETGTACVTNLSI